MFLTTHACMFLHTSLCLLSQQSWRFSTSAVMMGIRESCGERRKICAAPLYSWQHVDWGSKRDWSTAVEEEEEDEKASSRHFPRRFYAHFDSPSRQVHSLVLSSNRFLFQPLRLSPWTVPCRTVLASPYERVTCPYHFSLRLFTEAGHVLVNVTLWSDI